MLALAADAIFSKAKSNTGEVKVSPSISFKNHCSFYRVVLIPRNFKIFILKPKLSLLTKHHKNDNQGEFPDFYEFNLYLNFANFMKMVVFGKNFKNLQPIAYLQGVTYQSLPCDHSTSIDYIIVQAQYKHRLTHFV